ncbi:MAG TPA: hypothetical protein VF290_02800 [Pyrinomonadaceae bacterium]
MMKYFLLTLILLAGTLLPVQQTWTDDDIKKLIDECGVRTTQMTGRLYNSTFHVTDIDYVIDKQGRVKREQSKVFEVYPTNVGNWRRWIYVQVGENGVAFSTEKIARERDQAVKETQKLEQQASAHQVTTPYKPRFSSYGIKVEKRGGLSRTIWFINPTDFLVSHDFYAPQRVSFAGRETFVLRFRPRPGYVYDKTNVPYAEGVEDYGRAMSQLGGRIWIDAADKVIARLEATPSRELNESSTTPDDNAALLFELTRLPNGTWAPSVSSYNSYGREDVFWKTSLSRSRKYSDYKIFKTTVDVGKIEAGQKP